MNPTSSDVHVPVPMGPKKLHKTDMSPPLNNLEAHMIHAAYAAEGQAVPKAEPVEPGPGEKALPNLAQKLWKKLTTRKAPQGGIPVFVYQTLKDPKLQKKIFGSTVPSSQDAIDGVENDTFKTPEGDDYHTLDSAVNGEVPGQVLYLSQDQLAALDNWEDEYNRVLVTLKSGNKAWAYALKAEDKIGKSNEMDGLYDMQEIISGMDYEMEAQQISDPNTARDIALDNLADDPDYYKKKWNDDSIDKGLSLDLGSGVARAPGHIGLDLYPHDHGTVVHDLHMGIPFPDESAKEIRMVNAMQEMDDPKPLLSEIQRVLMPGGQFHYEGPNQIYNYPEWLEENEGHQEISKIEGNPKWVKQKFTRLVAPDAATAQDAEPRIGISQYDMLPADALLAMDAVGYYWSDATSSGRGNRLHGYPSQGALVGKGGPGSGPHKGSGGLKLAPSPDKQGGQKIQVHSTGPRDQARAHAEGLRAQGTNAYMRHVSGPKTGPNSVHQVYSHVKQSAEKKHRVAKVDKMKQIVYCVVLPANEADLQGDIMSPEDIEKTAHDYLLNSRVIGSNHTQPISARPVESYIAPVDIDWSDGQYGPQTITKGSWVIGIKIFDPTEWEKVLDGTYQGVSVGGLGLRDDLT